MSPTTPGRREPADVTAETYSAAVCEILDWANRLSVEELVVAACWNRIRPLPAGSGRVGLGLEERWRQTARDCAARVYAGDRLVHATAAADGTELPVVAYRRLDSVIRAAVVAVFRPPSVTAEEAHLLGEPYRLTRRLVDTVRVADPRVRPMVCTLAPAFAGTPEELVAAAAATLTDPA